MRKGIRSVKPQASRRAKKHPLVLSKSEGCFHNIVLFFGHMPSFHRVPRCTFRIHRASAHSICRMAVIVAEKPDAVNI
jgi:hypothetical protein